jgi:hypothetical protein
VSYPDLVDVPAAIVQGLGFAFLVWVCLWGFTIPWRYWRRLQGF